MLAQIEFIWVVEFASVAHLSVMQILWKTFMTELMFLPILIFQGNVTTTLLTGIIDRKESKISNTLKFFISIILSLLAFRFMNMVINDVVYGDANTYVDFINWNRFGSALNNVVFGTGAFVAYDQFMMRLKWKDKEARLIQDKLETELKFLKAQINPHFLFNTLNNIYSLARIKSDQTADAIMKLSEMLRFILYESENDKINIRDEIKMIDDFIDLQRLRFDKRFKITFKKDVDDRENTIAPFILLHFVENAFKHGISESRFESYISIVLVCKNGKLTAEIENSVERVGETDRRSQIGLDNIKKQLDLIYPDHQLIIDSNGNYFKVNLSIDL